MMAKWGAFGMKKDGTIVLFTSNEEKVKRSHSLVDDLIAHIQNVQFEISEDGKTLKVRGTRLRYTHFRKYNEDLECSADGKTYWIISVDEDFVKTHVIPDGKMRKFTISQTPLFSFLSSKPLSYDVNTLEEGWYCYKDNNAIEITSNAMQKFIIIQENE